MKKSLLGWVLLAGAAGLGFWWYRRQQSAGTGAPLTAGAANDLSNLQQVGSNISADLTPDIIAMQLEYSRKQSDRANCASYSHSDGTTRYYKDGYGKIIEMPAGVMPPNWCGYFGAP